MEKSFLDIPIEQKVKVDQKGGAMLSMSFGLGQRTLPMRASGGGQNFNIFFFFFSVIVFSTTCYNVFLKYLFFSLLVFKVGNIWKETSRRISGELTHY